VRIEREKERTRERENEGGRKRNLCVWYTYIHYIYSTHAYTYAYTLPKKFVNDVKLHENLRSVPTQDGRNIYMYIYNTYVKKEIVWGGGGTTGGGGKEQARKQASKEGRKKRWMHGSEGKTKEGRKMKEGILTNSHTNEAGGKRGGG
jgi:hypothetical protein